MGISFERVKKADGGVGNACLEKLGTSPSTSGFDVIESVGNRHRR